MNNLYGNIKSLLEQYNFILYSKEDEIISSSDYITIGDELYKTKVTIKNIKSKISDKYKP